MMPAHQKAGLAGVGRVEMFELLQELGKGGFATTYRARVLDPDLRDEFGTEIVALKIPLNKQKERVLRRELELNAGIHLRLRGLASTHIVRYLGFVSFHDQITMVMEYVEQGSLRRLVGPTGQSRPLPIAQAVQIAAGVLDGLSVIHDEGILHRDIKPENILMLGDVPKIADLGISRLLDQDELAMSFVGTPAYIAPEILTSHGATFSADLWSASVTLYEMLTGRWPFGASRIPLARMIDSICRDEPDPPSRFVPEIPPELDAIIARGLRKQPDERYPSAQEMRLALDRWLQPAAVVPSAGTPSASMPSASTPPASTIVLATPPQLPAATVPAALPSASAPGWPPAPASPPAPPQTPAPARTPAPAQTPAPAIVAPAASAFAAASTPSPLPPSQSPPPSLAGTVPVSGPVGITEGRILLREGLLAQTPTPADAPPVGRVGGLRMWHAAAAVVLVVLTAIATTYTIREWGRGPTGQGETGTTTAATLGTGAGGGTGNPAGTGNTPGGTGNDGSNGGNGKPPSQTGTTSPVVHGTVTHGTGGAGTGGAGNGGAVGGDAGRGGRTGKGGTGPTGSTGSIGSAASPEKACDAGEARACFDLAESAFAGRGVTQDDHRAATLYDRACQQHLATACYKLGTLYRDDRGVVRNVVKAADLFGQGCDGGVADACTDLGRAYIGGVGVMKDEAKAVTLFQRACDGDSGAGCVQLGGAYADGRGVTKDDVRAAGFFQRSCDLAYMPGCDALGTRYERGLGVRQDLKQAVTLFERSCTGGGVRGGCADLGRAYQSGFGGTPIDLPKAADLYKRACDAQNLIACVNLGFLYVSSDAFRADLPRALPLFERACEAKVSRGCFMAGRAYSMAQGVPKDDTRATELYRRACDGDWAPGCMAIASRYHNGTPPLARDDVQAATLYQRACDLKLADACAALASAYQEGRGVDKNPTRAAEMLQRARDLSGVDNPAFASTLAWLSSSEYQQLWGRQRSNGLHPARVEGRLRDGREEFRATSWDPTPMPCQVMSHHGLAKDVYDRRNAEYTAQGYRVASVDQFVGLGGAIKYQGVWTKGCAQ